MARSRPKLSQAPWTGMEALHKIMERFAEFGENLNRMASALHNLENSMQHLLGVTSRVTAAMLLLHGSMGYASGGGGRKGGMSEEDKKKRKEEVEAEEAKRLKDSGLRFELKALRQKLQDLSFKKTEIQGIVDRRLHQTQSMLFKAHLSKRARVEKMLVDEQMDPTTFLSKAKAFGKLKQDQTAAVSNTKASRVLVDTEYGVSMPSGLSHKEFREAYDKMSDQEKTQVHVPTQMSVRVVNELGQTLEHFSTNLKHKLGSNKLFSLFAKDDMEQAEYAAQLHKESATAVSPTKAAKELKAFAGKNFGDEKFFEKAAANADPTAPKIGGKNFLNADLPVLTNSFGAAIGKALGLSSLDPMNKDKAVYDPQSFYFEAFRGLIRHMDPEALEKVAKSFDLNAAQLAKVASAPDLKGISSQEAIAKLLGHTYKAHDASEDTNADALITPLLQSLYKSALVSLDREGLLERSGVTDAALLENFEIAKNKHDTDPANAELKKLMADAEASSAAIEKEIARVEDDLKPKPTPSPTPTPTPTPLPKASGFRDIKNSPFLRIIPNAFNNVDFTKIMSKGFKDLIESIKDLPKAIKHGSTALAGATMGLAQMASPDTFATLQGSLQLLGMNIGSAMIKPMLNLSSIIQKVAFSFENMSPEVEQLLGRIGEWSIAIAGLAIGLKGLGMVIAPIVALFKGLFSGMVGMGKLIQGGAGLFKADAMAALTRTSAPIATYAKFGMGMLKVVSVAGLLYEAFGSLSNIILGTNIPTLHRLASDMHQASIDKQFKDKEKAETNTMYSKDEAESKSAFENYAKNKLLAKDMYTATEEQAEAFKKNLKDSSRINLFGVSDPFLKLQDTSAIRENNDKLMEHPFMQAALKAGILPRHGALPKQYNAAAIEYGQAESNYRSALKEGDQRRADFNLAAMAKAINQLFEKPQLNNMAQEAKKFNSEFVQGAGMQPGGFNANLRTQVTEKQKKDAAQSFEKMGGFQGLLASFQSFRSQPQYMGVEEAHRRVQVQALGADPLQQKIEEVKSKYLQKMVDALEKMANEEDKSIIGFVKPYANMLGIGLGS